MMKEPYILILAGGAGTRFWPASREQYPKQFLKMTGSGKSLLRETFERFLQFVSEDRIYIVTHRDYVHLVENEFPSLSPQQIIAEPSRNNTAPSIAYASMKLAALDPDGVCIVAPADHVIAKKDVFIAHLRHAVAHADQHNSIITLGIEPSRPDTGYGYIEFDKSGEDTVRKVKSFREKPDYQTAVQYLASNSFAWNAGIFVWKFKTVIEAFHQYAPGIYAVLHAGESKWNTKEEQEFIATNYPSTEKISVDFAILEKADNVYTIPCEIGWSDLGTWNSLYEFTPKDADGNAVIESKTFLPEVHGTLVHAAPEKLIVVKGLEDYIIIDTPDCLLIYPRAEEQAIRALKEDLRDQQYSDYL